MAKPHMDALKMYLLMSVTTNDGDLELKHPNVTYVLANDWKPRSELSSTLPYRQQRFGEIDKAIYDSVQAKLKAARESAPGVSTEGNADLVELYGNAAGLVGLMQSEAFWAGEPPHPKDDVLDDWSDVLNA